MLGVPAAVLIAGTGLSTALAAMSTLRWMANRVPDDHPATDGPEDAAPANL